MSTPQATCPTADGYLGNFQLLALLKNAAMMILMFWLPKYVFSRYILYLEVEFLSQRMDAYVSFSRFC